MKRATILCIIVSICILIVGLGQTAVDPDLVTGKWYSYKDQSAFLFQEGLIYCSKHNVSLSDDDTISGAYCVGKDRIYLFALGIDGLDSGKEIYFVQKGETSLLCENIDGSGEIYFARIGS